MTEGQKKSILVVDDESSNIIALTKTLSPIYAVRVAINGPDAIKTAKRHQPDLILLDIVMPDMDGYAVLTALKNSEKTRDIPVIFLTAKNDSESEALGLRLGAHDYIHKPFSQELLLRRVDMHLRLNQDESDLEEEAREQSGASSEAAPEAEHAGVPLPYPGAGEVKKNSILIVDDESTNIVALTHILSHDYALRVATNGRDALKLAEQFRPDIILLDIVMPGMNGYEVIASLKNSATTKEIPVIFISSLSVDDDEEKGLGLGAADYIGKPFSPAIVKIRVRNQIQIVNQLRVITAASRAKSDFLANMSHEIRTPMNAILGFTELMMRDSTIPQSINESLGNIYSAGDLLLNIINDILDLSKIEAGKFELSPSNYEVADLIVDTVNLNMIRAGTKKIEFKVSVDEDIPATLLGDELRIRQILNNLLSNAFKYTEQGQVALSVSAESDGEGEEARLNLLFNVSDTGQGMTVEQIEVLFDPYSRFNFEANRSVEGIGLGMSITQSLVNMMSGEITVKSEPGVGTVFEVRLPQEQTASEPIGRDLALRIENFLATGDRRARKTGFIIEPMPYGSVLIVDDTESNLFVAKGLMQPYELTVETVTSGFEAIEKIKRGSVYDIVFMDHMMPRMDGIETVQQLREYGYTNPIVAKTASAIKGARELFLSHGFDDFISKPIDTQLLDEILKKFIRDKKPQEIVQAYGPLMNTYEGSSIYQEKERTLSPLFLEVFVRDVLRNVDVLKTVLTKGEYGDEDILDYVNSVHALKSALANAGEFGLSSFAGRLEQAGLNREVALMTDAGALFLGELHSTIKALSAEKAAEAAKEAEEADASDYIHLHQALDGIKKASETYDAKNVKDAIIALTRKKWTPAVVNDWVNAMPECLLSGDFDELMRIADKIMAETAHML